ncbi:MAG: hypothetical protein JXR41_11675 [Bacteroidales bacterium]|nr:hypothetical protein [Bacteroidales bacterium]
MGNSGIYIAKSGREPDKTFIFPAIDKDLCWGRHLESLKLGSHFEKKLQDHFKKNPDDEFEIKLLRPCHKADFERYRQHFINKYKPFFNIKTKNKTKNDENK